MTNKIDFVITWVDSSDQEWQKEKSRWLHAEKPDEQTDFSEVRYRDWENLKYFFRGVENCAPWVHKVILITNGQCPVWLNTDCEKLRLVFHEEYMPHEHLPTFNSNAIEVNINKIPGLSDQFVLFNDDMFILKRVEPEDFFINGKPCDSVAVSPIIPGDKLCFANTVANNMAIINTYFDKNTEIRKHPGLYFSPKNGTAMWRTFLTLPWKKYLGFYNTHIPNSILKSTMDVLWEKEYDALYETSGSRFRNHRTNINQWLFRYWQIASGNFVPRSIRFGHRFDYDEDNTAVYDAIKNRKYKTICLNDDKTNYDFEEEKKKTIEAFETIFPEKSRFEK